MGMSFEINGNSYLTQTSVQLQSLNSNCSETVVFNQSSVQTMPQLMTTGLDMNTLNTFNSTYNGLDLNQSLIIESNDCQTQQLLIVSSPLDQLMAVQQQSQQSIIPTDLQLISRGTHLNVIEVPTNLLLTDNNLIVIPQEGLTLEMPAINTLAAQQQQTTTVDDQICPTVQQVMVNLSPQCIAINNKVIDNNSLQQNLSQYYPTNHQIIGIIDANTSQPKLLATAQPTSPLPSDDLNAFLASTMAMTTNLEQEFDPNEAKGWLNDSLIAYRAMVAFKKVMPNETSSPTSGVRVHK